MAEQVSDLSRILQKITDQVGAATTLRGRDNIVTELNREELTVIQKWLADRLQFDIITVAAISQREVEDQTITFTLDGHRHAVPVRVFVERDVSYVAKRIKEAQNNAEKRAE